ncbi:HIRAN domain-containing protein [Sinomonas sp. RB5]
MDLAGASHYLPAIRAALNSGDTSNTGTGSSREAEGLRVVLVPEPDNPYDSNAISVRWAGRTIGYLSREDAARYSQPVRRITASGFAPVSAARIWAWDGAQMTDARVTVALPEPELIAPLNEPPTTTHTLVPWGAAVQVLRTEDHFSALFDYIPEEGVGLLLVSLHKAMRTLKNGTLRSFVEVRLDGNRVGELSGTTSPHYLPLLEHTETVGELAVCYAKITGSPLAAKLALQAQRASEISNSWLANSPHPAPRLTPWARSYNVPAAYVPRH